MSTEQILEIIDYKQPEIKRNLILASGSLCLLIVAFFSKILQRNGFPPVLILNVLPFLIVSTVFHEAWHYVPQWYFSKQRPHFGFTSLGPFSALSPGSSITRNQAILCALVPTSILLPIILIPVLFASLLFKILLLAWAASELATSYADFHLAYRLLKNPRDSLLKNVNNTNVIFRRRG